MRRRKGKRGNRLTAVKKPAFCEGDHREAEDATEPYLTRGHNERGKSWVTVKELSDFDNICLIITSRIKTAPNCECLDIPTMSIYAARHTFYSITNCNRISSTIS